MKLNIITETQAREFAKEEFQNFEKRIYREMDRLRKRIVELEQRHMDIKKFKLVRKNEK